MIPSHFPQANERFGPPPGLDPSQIRPISAYHGRVEGGNLDGVEIVITAWQPSPDEVADILAGQPIYLSFLGALPPHMASTDFERAKHPS